MKRTLRILVCLMLVAAMVAAFAGCGNADNEGDVTESPSPSGDGEPMESEAPASDVMIAVITSAAGQNDNGYNQSAVVGLEKVGQELGAETKVVETEDIDGALKALAEEGYDLIFSLEYNFEALINGVGGEAPIAEQYPDTTFVVFNAEPNKDESGSAIQQNVISVLFDVHEASFLAGALSAQVIENQDVLFGDSHDLTPVDDGGRTVGFIGGTNSAGITVFSYGFAEGVNYVAEELGVDYTYYADYSAGFSDSATGSQIANTMYSQGANVVYACAGVVGDGVTAKANELMKLSIQVDANRDGDQPGYVLTSVLKNTEVPVYELSQALIEDTLADKMGQSVFYDLGSKATGITDLSTIEGFVQESGMEKWDEIKTYVDELAAQIADGTIVVTDAQAGESITSDDLSNVTIAE
mgnify:CR=1 FL=1